jgi:hypothetical protein
MRMIQKTFLLLAAILLGCNTIGGQSEIVVAKKDYSPFHNEARAYCKAQNFNEDYYFLIDLSVHSGKNRFFIYDFKADKISDENLVTHGSCDQFEGNDTKWEKAKFSNRNNSHCSSKGKYRIGIIAPGESR